MIDANSKQTIKYTEIPKIIKQAKNDCDNLLMEHHSNEYVINFVNHLHRKLDIIESIYLQLLKEPRINWKVIQSKMENLIKEDPSIAGIILTLHFAGREGYNRGKIEHELPKKR